MSARVPSLDVSVVFGANEEHIAEALASEIGFTHRDGRVLLTVGADGIARKWDAARGTLEEGGAV